MWIENSQKLPKQGRRERRRALYLDFWNRKHMCLQVISSFMLSSLPIRYDFVHIHVPVSGGLPCNERKMVIQLSSVNLICKKYAVDPASAAEVSRREIKIL